MITIKEHNAILLEFKVRNKHLQKELERTEKENKRYREAIEKVENKIKFNDELIKHYSRDDWYSDISHRKKVLDGETFGIEIALEIINKTLEGEADE